MNSMQFFGLYWEREREREKKREKRERKYKKLTGNKTKPSTNRKIPPPVVR